MENFIKRAKVVLTYVRTHKKLIATAVAAAVALTARFVPSLPADDILRDVAAVLDLIAA